MNTRSQLMMTATALIAGLTLCAGAAGAQRFQPQFPIVQNEAAPERAPAGAFDNAPAVQPDYAAPADAPRYDPAPTDPAAAPPEPTQPAAPATPPDSRAYSAGATAADIAMQPAKDIGIKRTQIPQVLLDSEVSPYAMADTANCARMAQALAQLDEALGPDYTVEKTADASRAGKITEAGGRAIVNSIIPFRGIVREVTGAAADDRRYASAVDAGIARRGFLRGLQTAQGCDVGQQASLAR